jgi:hypothetical protein
VIAIQCANCAFTYGFFEDDDVRRWSRPCPQCHTAAPRVYVEVDPPPSPLWIVVDQLRQTVAGPFTDPAAAHRWIMAHFPLGHPRGPLDVVRDTPEPPRTSSRRSTPVQREPVPALIDALDVTLALWIAQAMLDSRT